MKQEPDLLKKEKAVLHGTEDKLGEWLKDNDFDSSVDIGRKHSRRVYNHDQHLGHAAGDYEPFHHEGNDDPKQRPAGKTAQNKVPPASFSDEQFDENLHLRIEEDYRAVEIEMIRSSYGAMEQDRQ